MKGIIRNFFTAAALGVSVLVSGVVGEICEVRLDCPTNWGDDTVRVPRNAVILSGSFDHCAPTKFIEAPGGSQKDTVSVFFIIDHSGSMRVRDSNNVRYTVVSSMIDSIAAKSPASEIGLAVFSNQLLHNYQDDPHYVQLNPDSGWTDAYIPLTKLSSTVDGMSAVQKLKQSIALSETERDPLYGNLKLVNADYGSTGRHYVDTNTHTPMQGYTGTTDVSIGFEAARQAFQTASNPTHRQYIIFLSDGEDQNVDEERKAFQKDYLLGQGIPTTYTAFFINQNELIPNELKVMTTNIQQNGYSSENANSKIWKQSGSTSDLLSNLLNLTMNNNSGLHQSTPLRITVNGVTTTNFNDSFAVFQMPIALQGPTTILDVSYVWRFTTPTVQVDSVRYSVTVVQSDSPDLQSLDCWEQGSIGLYYNGQQVNLISEDMSRLEVRFFPPEATVSQVKVGASNSSYTDSVPVSLTNKGSYWSGLFDREYGLPKADNILQNENGDSLILVYRNPAIPLDTLRLAVPIASQRDIAVRRAYLIDRSGNGYPDLIRVIQGDEKITAADCSLMVKAVSVSTTRFTIDSIIPDADGFLTKLKETSTSAAPNTGVLSSEKLFINRVALNSGGTIPVTEVPLIDSIAPVAVSAVYKDFNEVSDTLTVTFSEPVDQIYSSYPLLFYRGTESYSPRLEFVKSSGSTITFSVMQTTGMSAQDGDKLNIDVAGSISDTLMNVQNNPANPKVVIDYQVLYKPLTATYLDNNRDGKVDMISITTDRPVDSTILKDFNAAVKLPLFRDFTYSPSDLIVTDSGFIIKVKQNSEPLTSIDARDVVVVDSSRIDEGIQPARLKVTDQMAPVITKAVFIPSDVAVPNGDTLVVTFSEAVEIPSTPFPFIFTSGKDTYNMELVFAEKRGDQYVFSVSRIINKDFPVAGDSITIDPDAGIRDLQGNVQNAPNRKVALQIRAKDPGYTMIISANPYEPGSPAIPAELRSEYGITAQQGLVVVAVPKRTSMGMKITADMVIYDATGNIVVKFKAMGNPSYKNAVVFVWDGNNRFGRPVGSGAYMTMLKIESEGTGTTSKTTQNTKTLWKKIGVKGLPYIK